MTAVTAMSRPTVFCLHYLGGSKRVWAPVDDWLGDALRLVPIDLPGFGQAANIEQGYSVAAMVGYVAQAIRSLAPPQWILVGHSMGAKVAAALARSAEDGAQGLDGLRGLMMIAGSPPAPEPMDENQRLTMLGWFRGDEKSKHSEASQYIANNVGAPLPRALSDLAIDEVLRANRAAWEAWLEAGSRENWADEVGLLNTPALIVAGVKDGNLGPQAQRRWMAPHFRRSRLVTLPDAGHLLPLERPEEIAGLIVEHAHGLMAACAA